MIPDAGSIGVSSQPQNIDGLSLGERKQYPPLHLSISKAEGTEIRRKKKVKVKVK